MPLTIDAMPRHGAASKGHPDSNKVQPQDRPVHEWYRFVLSFPPHLVREYVSRFGLRTGQVVLDPFCGTGTTPVECAKLGIESIGIEANPMACFASRVKLDWQIAPGHLFRHARTVAEEALAKLQAEGIEDDPVPPLFRKPAVRSPQLLALPEESSKLLLSNSVSPLPLHKTLTLLSALDRQRDQVPAGHERLAVAKALVSGISNLEFGPEVGVGCPKADAPVVKIWLKCIKTMCEDLEELPRTASAAAIIHQADARRLTRIVEPQSVDGVITSPPYPNEKDYTRTTRLESIILGFIRNREDLRRLKEDLVRSNTRNVYKNDSDDENISGNSEVQRIACAIEARRQALGKTSGFERQYARVTRLYFGGMAKHLSELRYVLKAGARLAYVVGDQASYLRVLIRTGQLLAEIATSLGYRVAGIDLFRTRLATATREQLREEVVLLEWPGW